jgi:translation initiation factor 5
MSELINIGEVKDEHYRYKMPKPILKVEGKGNGIKTVIPNMLDISKALKIPPEYITKYFGFSGSQSKYDANTGKAVVNGKLDMITAMATFNEFIKKFILCSKCKLPETFMSVDTKEVIHMKCNACGYDTIVDNQEKLSAFIINHPPPKQQ